jgi:hypothetical protein
MINGGTIDRVEGSEKDQAVLSCFGNKLLFLRITLAASHSASSSSAANMAVNLGSCHGKTLALFTLDPGFFEAVKRPEDDETSLEKGREER